MRNNQAQMHIQRLFDERARNDPNSTTLANTLNKDIETVFNSPEKFILELLQNADDASNDRQENSVVFTIRKDVLLFSHQGQAFGSDDVNAICDNAPQGHREKRANAEKIGYKGIGFKSVFVVATQVVIISGDYSFRFDKHYSQWQQDTSITRCYPWQIIPIWTPATGLASSFKIDKKAVNFLLELKSGTALIPAFEAILRDSKMLLFLRHVGRVTVDINGKKNSISRSCLGKHCDLYLNNLPLSHWVVERYDMSISDRLHEKMQLMGAHECPEKLKKAKTTQIVLVFQTEQQYNIRPLSTSPLYSYLPTALESGLPFLINADFLLTADRMQLLHNDWNSYLAKAVAFYHVVLLTEMAEDQHFYHQVLTLLTLKLPASLPLWFRTAYKSALDRALKTEAFITAKSVTKNSVLPELLTYDGAVADDLRFFESMSGIDPEYEKSLVSVNLLSQDKLAHHFTLSVLLKKLNRYMKKLADPVKQAALIHVLWLHARHVNPKVLSTLAFLPSAQGELLTPEKLFVLGNVSLINLPDCLGLQWLNPLLLSKLSTKESQWLQELGVQSLSNQLLLGKLGECVRSFKDVLSVSHQTAKELFDLLYAIYTDSGLPIIYSYGVKNRFPLLTQAGNLQAAQSCYLPSELNPDLDLQAMVDSPELFLSDYYQEHYVAKKLTELLKLLGVQSTLKLHISPYSTDTNTAIANVDYYKEYEQHLVSVDQVNYFGGTSYINGFAYLDFMRFLCFPGYVRYFWKEIAANAKALLESCANPSVSVRSKKRRRTYPVTHYLGFMASRFACIQAEDGQYYQATALYNFALVEQFDQSLRDLLAPVVSRRQAGHLIPSTVFALFNLKNQLAMSDVIALFRWIAANSEPQKRQKHLQTLSQCVVKSHFSAQELALLRQENPYLLAENGELMPANSLYYLMPHKTSKSTNHLFESVAETQVHKGIYRVLKVKHPTLSRFIKHFRGLSPVEHQQWCEVFKLPAVTIAAANIVAEKSKQSEVSALPGHFANFLQLLKYGTLYFFYGMAEEKKVHHLPQYYQDFCGQVNRLTLVDSDCLMLSWQEEGQLELALDVLLIDNTLYINGMLTAVKLLEHMISAIGAYLDLSQNLIDKMQLLSRYPEEDRREIIEQAGFDPHDIVAMADASALAVQQPAIDAALPYTVLTASELRASQTTQVSPLEGEGSLASSFTTQDATKSSSKSLRSMMEKIEVPMQTLSLNRSDRNEQAADYEVSSLMTVPAELPAPKKAIVSKATPGEFSAAIDYDSGRCGEEVVLHALKQHYRKKYAKSRFTETASGFVLKGGRLNQLKVTWLNQQQESGFSADFTIEKNKQLRYVEVKSTYQSRQDTLRIKKGEWELMRQAGNRYRLFCVVNVGKESGVVISKIKDPAQKIMSGALTPREIHLLLNKPSTPVAEKACVASSSLTESAPVAPAHHLRSPGQLSYAAALTKPVLPASPQPLSAADLTASLFHVTVDSRTIKKQQPSRKVTVPDLVNTADFPALT